MRATAKNSAERAKMSNEVARFLTSLGEVGNDRQALRDSTINFRQDQARQYAGHSPGIWDLGDDITTALQAAKATGDAVSAFEPQWAKEALDDIGARIKAGVGVIEDVEAMPWAANWMSDRRARSGADHAAAVADAYDGLDEVSMRALATAINHDPTGQVMAAAKDLWPDYFNNPSRKDLTAGGCVSDHPEVFNQLNVTVKADNSVVVNDIDQSTVQILDSIQQLSDQQTEALTGINQQLQIVNDQNALITTEVGNIQAFLKDQQTHQAQAEAAARAAQAAQQLTEAYWDAAGAAVAGASAVAYLLGQPKLSHDIQRFGNAGMTVVKAVAQVVDAASALAKGFSAVTALGTAVATGNLLGAVAGLVQVFQPEQPDPEQQILQGIADLHQQLDDMSKQIGEGFDRLDRRLTDAYTSIMTSLADIATTAHMTLARVQEIEETLADQQRMLGQLAVETAEWFKAGERSQLLLDVNTALDWAATNSSPMTEQQFDEFLGHFYTWAVVLAFDEINQPVTGRPLDLASAAAGLQGSVNDNLSYLNLLLVTSGRPGLASAGDTLNHQLPNPQTWAVAAGAFAQLRSQWPSLAKPNDARVEEIAKVGQDLIAAIRALVRDATVYPAVAGDHLNAYWAVHGTVESLRAEFQGQLWQTLGYSAGSPESAGRVDLIGGETQSFHYELPVSQVVAEDGSWNIDNSGPGLAALRLYALVPDPFLLAQWLNPGQPQINFSWSASWTQGKWVDSPKGGGGHFVNGHVYITITARFGMSAIGTRTVSIELHDEPTPLSGWVKKQWSGGPNPISDLFLSEAGRPAGTVQYSPEVGAQADQMALDGLTRVRRLFAERLLAEGGPAGRLGTALATLQGAHLLMDRLTQITMPGPRAGDDLLRASFAGASPAKGGIRLPDADQLLQDLTMTGGPFDGGRGPALKDWMTTYVAGLHTQLTERIAGWQQHFADGTSTNPTPHDQTLIALDACRSAVAAAQTRKALVEKPTPAVQAIQKAVHLAHSGIWNGRTAAALKVLRNAAHLGRRSDLPALRSAIGSMRTGAWSDADQKLMVQAVRTVQRPLGVPVDGAWGPITDTSYKRLVAFVRDMRGGN